MGVDGGVRKDGKGAAHATRGVTRVDVSGRASRRGAKRIEGCGGGWCVPRAKQHHPCKQAKDGTGGMARTAVANGLISNTILLPREREGGEGGGMQAGRPRGRAGDPGHIPPPRTSHRRVETSCRLGRSVAQGIRRVKEERRNRERRPRPQQRLRGSALGGPE